MEQGTGNYNLLLEGFADAGNCVPGKNIRKRKKRMNGSKARNIRRKPNPMKILTTPFFISTDDKKKKTGPMLFLTHPRFQSESVRFILATVRLSPERLQNFQREGETEFERVRSFSTTDGLASERLQNFRTTDENKFERVRKSQTTPGKSLTTVQKSLETVHFTPTTLQNFSRRHKNLSERLALEPGTQGKCSERVDPESGKHKNIPTTLPCGADGQEKSAETLKNLPEILKNLTDGRVKLSETHNNIPGSHDFFSEIFQK